MNRFLFLTFFFIISCSTSKSKVFPEENFLSLKEKQSFPVNNQYLTQQAVSVFSRLTLSRLIAKHVVNLSTLYVSPDNIRVDVFSAGLPKLVFLVSRNKDNVQLVSPEEHVVYLGDTNSRPLERVMGFPLSESFLLDLLLGQSKLPEQVNSIEHSNFSIYRVEFKGDANFKYRLYFKNISCASTQEAEHYKFSGLEVLTEDDKYLFFAKTKFEKADEKPCALVFPSQIEFENFGNRFSGLIDKIQLKLDLSFNESDTVRVFYPSFPGYLVKPLLSSELKK